MQNLKFHYIHFQLLTGKKGRSWGGGGGGGDPESLVTQQRTKLVTQVIKIYIYIYIYIYHKNQSGVKLFQHKIPHLWVLVAARMRSLCHTRKTAVRA